MDGVEEGEGDEGQLGDLEEDLPALTLGGLGAGAVRAECNPVRCRNGVSAGVSDRIFLERIPG